MDCGNTKTPNMHCRLGSLTVAASFPRGVQCKFSIEEIPMGQYSYKKIFLKMNCDQFVTMRAAGTASLWWRSGGARQITDIVGLGCTFKCFFIYSYTVLCVYIPAL